MATQRKKKKKWYDRQKRKGFGRATGEYVKKGKVRKFCLVVERTGDIHVYDNPINAKEDSWYQK